MLSSFVHCRAISRPSIRVARTVWAIRMASSSCNGAISNSAVLSKVELHNHMDGAVKWTTLHDFAKQKGMKIGSQDPSEIRKYCLYHEEDEHSLSRFLDAFFYFMPILRGDPNFLERMAYEFCEDQAQQGCLYTEARFSPHLLASSVHWDGMHQHEFISDAHRDAHEKAPPVSTDQVVDAIGRGLKRGMADFGIIVRLLLCCITHRPDLSMEVVELANKHRNNFVVGIDLAGFEDAEPMEKHKSAFDRAKELGIHRTVHAGETGNAGNVQKAIDVLHAERIGHGYAVEKDAGVYDGVLQSQTHLEACIYSSHCTGALKTIPHKRHPVVKWHADGINCSLSTDDSGVMQNTLSEEYERGRKDGLSNDDLVEMCFKAARSCFLPADEKAKLIAKLNEIHQTDYQ